MFKIVFIIFLMVYLFIYYKYKPLFLIL
jgi:hypothetical protein